MAKTAATGLWFDTIKRRFTVDQPSEAIQVIAPGMPIPIEHQALYDTVAKGGQATEVETAVEPEVETATLAEPAPVADGDLVALGGGWWELPNGERIRGREQAEEALQEIRAR